MLPSTGEIKKTAKSIMKGKYIPCLTTGLIFLFASIALFFLCDIISSVTMVYMGTFLFVVLLLFLIFPLFMGVIRYFFRISDDVTDNPVSIFYYFSDFKTYDRIFGFTVRIFLKLAFSGFVLFLPYALLKLFSSTFIYDKLNVLTPTWTPILSTVGDFALVIAIILYVIINLKYYLSFYIFASSDYITGSDAIKYSVIISRRTKADFLFLIFSMVGYIILSVLLVSILFVFPLFISVYVVHSRCAVNQYNETITNLKNRSFG